LKLDINKSDTTLETQTHQNIEGWIIKKNLTNKKLRMLLRNHMACHII